MDKLIKCSEGFGLLQISDGNSQVTALEKYSDARSGQLNRLQQVHGIDPRVIAWIRKEPLDFRKYVYTLVVPLGADESWEETVNGDAFLRDDLRPVNPRFGHKTFESHAVAYMHHKNKNPAFGFGDTPFMVYADDMDRVEGIWRLDRQRASRFGASHVVDAIDNGRLVDISMGCKVPFDVCSYCGNKAKTRKFYCSHTVNPGFGGIDTAGRKMRVFNPKPIFFDLSGVTVKAAPESVVLGGITSEIAKLIKEVGDSSSHLLIGPEGRRVEKVSDVSVIKVSDIVKHIPAVFSEVIEPLQKTEEALTPSMMKSSGIGEVPMPAALSTLAALGVILSPSEFSDCYAVTNHAPALEGKTISTEAITHHMRSGLSDLGDLSAQWFNPGLASNFGDLLHSRSILYPFLKQRIISSTKRSRQVRSLNHFRRISPIRELAQKYLMYINSLRYGLGNLLSSTFSNFPLHRTKLITQGALADPQHSRHLSDRESLQSILPAVYILSRLGRSSPKSVIHTVRMLNSPGVEEFLGGVL